MINCKSCGHETSECPPEFPPEWRGFCPRCAISSMFKGELPACEPNLFANLVEVAAVIEVVVPMKEPEPDLDMAFSGTGQVMLYHKADLCEGQFCPMHNPSDHHMKTWPMHGRSDLKLPLIERICPHDATHPDPDSLAWCLRMSPEFTAHHGACDGCCKAA